MEILKFHLMKAHEALFKHNRPRIGYCLVVSTWTADRILGYLSELWKFPLKQFKQRNFIYEGKIWNFKCNYNAIKCKFCSTFTLNENDIRITDKYGILIAHSIYKTLSNYILVSVYEWHIHHENFLIFKFYSIDFPLAPTCVRASHITASSALISWLPSNSNFQHVVAVNSVEVKVVKPGCFRHHVTGNRFAYIILGYFFVSVIADRNLTNLSDNSHKLAAFKKKFFTFMTTVYWNRF